MAASFGLATPLRFSSLSLSFAAEATLPHYAISFSAFSFLFAISTAFAFAEGQPPAIDIADDIIAIMNITPGHCHYTLAPPLLIISITGIITTAASASRRQPPLLQSIEYFRFSIGCAGCCRYFRFQSFSLIDFRHIFN